MGTEIGLTASWVAPALAIENLYMRRIAACVNFLDGIPTADLEAIADKRGPREQTLLQQSANGSAAPACQHCGLREDRHHDRGLGCLRWQAAGDFGPDGRVVYRRYFTALSEKPAGDSIGLWLMLVEGEWRLLRAELGPVRAKGEYGPDGQRLYRRFDIAIDNHAGIPIAYWFAIWLTMAEGAWQITFDGLVRVVVDAAPPAV